MGSQFIGLILLILAVAAGIYVATNYAGLINLKIPVPVIIRPLGTPPSMDNKSQAGVSGNSAPVLEAKKAARIGYIRLPNSYSNYFEVSIYSNLGRDESANITGWTVKSNSGSFKIPRAQEEYSFGGAQWNINLRPGDKVNFYSGTGPKGNFRMNKCMGYIEDISPFTPSLPKSCPYISRPEINNFSGGCQDYILSLRSCQEPSANPPVPLDDNACRDFLRKLNYAGCVEKYRKDSDFFSNDWRIWMGGELDIFDPLHDKVQLIDQKGKVVDEYTY